MIKNNRIRLFYEKMGQGPNLIMLHGNGEDHLSLITLAQSMKDYFTIYLIDSRGHGQSEGDIAKDYQEMAIDFIEFLNEHDIFHTHVFGFSDGAIIVLKAAVMQPGRFNKLILCGLNTHPTGLLDKTIGEIRDAYQKNKDPKLALMLNGPIFKPFDFDKVKHQILLYFGEHDVIKPSHITEISDQLKNSRLRILTGQTHDSYVMISKFLSEDILTFLNNSESS